MVLLVAAKPRHTRDLQFPASCWRRALLPIFCRDQSSRLEGSRTQVSRKASPERGVAFGGCRRWPPGQVSGASARLLLSPAVSPGDWHSEPNRPAVRLPGLFLCSTPTSHSTICWQTLG